MAPAPLVPNAVPALHVILAVALGGSVGALARFGVYDAIGRQGRHHGPWATMLVNLIGCLALGLILGWISRRGEMDERLRAFLTVGILGAFTTFSTYAGDGLKLIQQGKVPLAFTYLIASAVLGLALCWGGYVLGAKLA